MQGLVDDVLLAIHHRLDIVSSEALALSCRHVHRALASALRRDRESCDEYQPLFHKLLPHFDVVTVHHLGLVATFRHILMSECLTMNDVLRLEALGSSPATVVAETPSSARIRHMVRDARLCEYEHLSGDRSVVTIGSFVDALTHPPIKTFVAGYSHELTLYLAVSTMKTLPRTCDGYFYSWGFADRVGGVGRFSDATPLSLRPSSITSGGGV